MAVGGQTCCSGCHQNMLFPLGATVVQCTNCSSITHCPSLKNFTCRGCGLQLAYCASSDVTSVLCTVCNTLRDIVSIEMENFSLQYGHKRNVTCSQQESTSSIETISRAFHLSSLASDYDENGDELTQAPQPLQYEEEFTGSYKPANPSIHKET